MERKAEDETIVIQIRNSDQYEIQRIIKERVDGAKILAIINEIENGPQGIKTLEAQLKEEPNTHDMVMAEYNNKLGILRKRLEKFKQFEDRIPKPEAKAVPDVEKTEDKAERTADEAAKEDA